MKKNIFKFITTIMLALTLCVTINHTALSLQETPNTEITERVPDSHIIIDKPNPWDYYRVLQNRYDK